MVDLSTFSINIPKVRDNGEPMGQWAESGAEYCLRGAGMANLVIGFIRDGRHFVWRINKKELARILTDNRDDCDHRLLAADVEGERVQSVHYITDIFRPLVNSFASSLQFIASPSLVLIRGEQMNEICAQTGLLSSLVGDKSSIKIPDFTKMNVVSALEIPDFTLCLPAGISDRRNHPVICVEIKPKQGFVADDLRQDLLGGEGISYCLNCAVQYEKCRASGNSNIYDYCPLDLYSGDEKRMTRALNDLLRSGHKHMRLFRNGKVVCDKDNRLTSNQLRRLLFDGEDVRDGDIDFIAILVRLLRYSHDSTESESPGLPRGCVLDALLRGQQLDRLGLSKAAEMLEELSALAGPCSDWISFFFGDTLSHLSPEDQSKVLQLRGSLVCATLRDCSIMITMQAVEDNASWRDDNPEDSFLPFRISDRLWYFNHIDGHDSRALLNCPQRTYHLRSGTNKDENDPMAKTVLAVAAVSYQNDPTAIECQLYLRQEFYRHSGYDWLFPNLTAHQRGHNVDCAR